MDEPRVSAECPELHHYTDWEGLKGIVTSRTIWATDYRHLNDVTEVTHFMAHLVSSLRDRLMAYFRGRIRTDREFKKRVRGFGPIHEVATKGAQDFVDSLNEVTFGGHGMSGQKVPPFAEPFIASFCSHRDDEPYVKENGLLSQWKGYGRKEGYAIVFETKALEKLLNKETSKYQYLSRSFYYVIYGHELKKHDAWYTEFIDMLFPILKEMIDEKKPGLGPLYDELLKRAARLKHQAFQEEREVRIIANPTTKELDDYVRRNQPGAYKPSDKPFKQILSNSVAGKRHIALFDFEHRSVLPIRRIIVGPHPMQKENAKKVGALIKEGIKVTVSDTPWIGG